MMPMGFEDLPEFAAATQVRGLIDRIFGHLAPPPPLSIRQWAERYRIMSAEETPLPGPYDAGVTPVISDILDMLSAPGVRMAVVQKSAQIGYTAGVVCNVLGYHTHWRPSTQVVVFPRDQAAKDFAAEKFDPMVRSTPALSERIHLRSRALGNSQTRKRYPGGLIKLVGSLSPSGVKSTSARIVIIEEPDDVTEDLKGQGSAIRLAQERAKWFDDALILIGGTPTAKGASAIETMMGQTDQRKCHIACHECGEAHVLDWSNVSIPVRADGLEHPVYGARDWQRAAYACPHCGSLWSDGQRVANIQERREWIATGEGNGTAIGMHTSELYATGASSHIPLLARKFLEADAKMQAGDASLMIAFANNTLGQAWEYKGELPESSDLADRAEKYAEWSCPAGGLVPLINVDVQHDRLAITCWVVGRAEEMWLAYWGEVHGQTVVAHAGAWLELEESDGRSPGAARLGRRVADRSRRDRLLGWPDQRCGVRVRPPAQPPPPAGARAQRRARRYRPGGNLAAAQGDRSQWPINKSRQIWGPGAYRRRRARQGFADRLRDRIWPIAADRLRPGPHALVRYGPR